MDKHEWKWFRAGRMHQASFETAEDVAALAGLDKKHWLAISMPVSSVRFDARMLRLMDADGDGRIRTPEVVAAVEFLKSKNVDLGSLFKPSAEDEKKLADVVSRQADLAKAPLSAADKKALAAWEEEGKKKEIAFLGDATAAAEAALSAVEAAIDAYFTPPEDMPLVTDEPDKVLPLREKINPKHLEAMIDFSEKCVKPVLGDVREIDRIGWKKTKGAFAAYRAWAAARPVANAALKGELETEERILRYKLHLLEFLENFVNMRRLYSEDELAIFQTGVLRIDAKELNLCFDVASEAAHSALSGKSNCCVLYLKISRPSEGAVREICAVVTAGAVAGLYAGRNGVFYDRDGKDWDAVVTKVVESQVSLAEAFWAPWRKLGDGIGSMVKKFFGEKQAAADKVVETGAQSAQAGGAAMASSVAAIGIGIGMVGAAAASLMAAVSGMSAPQILVSVLALVLVVSMPSVVLTWFKLRKRDIGAILNASGWAVNRPMYFSMKRARAFTKCAVCPCMKRLAIALAVLVAAGLCAWGALEYSRCRKAARAQCAPAAEIATEAGEAKTPAAEAPAPEAPAGEADAAPAAVPQA